MHRTIGVIGREVVIAEAIKEIKKGKHVVIAGPMGIGKSAVLQKALEGVERRSERREELQLEANTAPHNHPLPTPDHRCEQRFMLIYTAEHLAKAQFVEITRQLFEAGVIKIDDLNISLPKKKKNEDDDEDEDVVLEWNDIQRSVKRLSIQELTRAIIPCVHAHHDGHGARVIIAVDDMTRLTPTQQAFWLSIFDCTQVVTCASERKQGLRKLWWKMKVIDVPPLSLDASQKIVTEFIHKQGMMIESPDLYIGHVVKQAAGNPQAINDMLDESSKEKIVKKRQIREMKHQAGIRYFDFTPVVIIVAVLGVSMRYISRGMDDMAIYIMAGVGASLLVALRMIATLGSRGGAR